MSASSGSKLSIFGRGPFVVPNIFKLLAIALLSVFVFLHFPLNFQLSCCYCLQIGPPFFLQVADL